MASIKITQLLCPSSKYGIKCPYSLTPTSVTIHNTANDASAKNEVQYMISNNNQVSYHYAVDDKGAYQGIPDFRNAWHAGNATGNRNSLSIEICYSRSGGARFTAAEKNAAILAAAKLKQYGLGIDKLRTHQSWSGKDCPHRTIDLGWVRFKNLVKSYMDGYTVDVGTATSTSTKSSASSTYTGGSIVDYLNSIGQDSSFSARKALATKHGISNYKGTAAQNSTLLAKLRAANTSKKSATTKTSTATKSGYTGGSIVDYLKSVGQSSTFTNRKALAAKHGISGYTGTAAQNKQLLKKLRGF